MLGVIFPVFGLPAFLFLGSRTLVLHSSEQFTAFLLDAPFVVDEQCFGQPRGVLHAQLVSGILFEPLLHLVAAFAHLIQHFHGVLPVFFQSVLRQLLVYLVARQVVQD